MDPLSLLWLCFILAALQPAVQRYFLVLQRRRTRSRWTGALPDRPELPRRRERPRRARARRRSGT